MSLIGSFFAPSFFPRDVFDEIWDLIGSVSEGFPSYSLIQHLRHKRDDLFSKFQTYLSCITLKSNASHLTRFA